MDVDIETLARYPTNSDDWIVTVAIGGIALLFSFLIVPWFIVSGYMIRAIRAGMDRAEQPPAFDEWGNLLKEGVVAGIIGLIYQLIPLLVFFVVVGGSFLAFLSGSDAGAGLGLFGFLGGMFLSWILAILFAYIGLAGIANYAREGTFGAGFDFGVITDVITSRDYLIAWGYVIALNIVVGVIITVLNIVPFLGAIVGVFVVFYSLIIAAWLWGNGFAATTGSRRPQRTSTPEEASDKAGPSKR
jgi:hypothetical protein